MPGDDARPDPRTILEQERERRRKSGREAARALEHAELMAEAKVQYERLTADPPEGKWPLGARAKHKKRKKKAPPK